MNRRSFMQAPLSLMLPTAKPHQSNYNWLSSLSGTAVAPPKFTFWEKVAHRLVREDERDPGYGDVIFYVGRITGVNFVTNGFSVNDAPWERGCRWVYAVLWLSFPNKEETEYAATQDWMGEEELEAYSVAEHSSSPQYLIPKHRYH